MIRRLSSELVRTDQQAHLAGGIVYIAILGALVWRLPLGIDLSDETYYAIFVDDWLKGGIHSSTLTTLHQTALLLPYFALKVYAAATGSTEGLVMVLRGLFLCGSAVASVAWLSFLLRVDAKACAWLAAGFALAFIPFGLPSVSYNTLGMQGLAIALSGLGIALREDRLSSGWAALSAVGWAVAVTAYPSMAAPLGATFLLLVLTCRKFRGVIAYGSLVAAAQIFAWGLVLYALSPQKLLASIAYLTAINDVADWSRKLAFSRSIVTSHPTMAVACTAALLLGLMRNRLGNLLTSLGVTAIVALSFTAPYALFVRSHDIVTIVALSGVGYIFCLGPANPPALRAISFVWTIGIIAGLTSTVSAFNSLFNFPVGGVAAAVTALAGPRPDTRSMIGARLLTQIAAIAGVLAPSLTFYYGDLPNAPLPASRVARGAFAGLFGQPDQVAEILRFRDEVSPLIGPDNAIAFVGRLYGLVLVTPARPLMLAVFPLDDSMNARGLEMSRDFFRDPANRAGIAVIERDQYITPLNPIGHCFRHWYEPVSSSNTPLGHFEVYRLSSQTGRDLDCPSG